MDLLEFFGRVEVHPELEGVGLVPERDGAGPALVVRHRPTQLLTRIEVAALERHDWPELEAVFVGAREPVVLVHMARIVGYYSRCDNWNLSKVGELRDRRRGDYAVPETDYEQSM